MIWIIVNDESHQIISCNIHSADGRHQLWVTRPNGKNLKVLEKDTHSEIMEVKEAIDYAISSGYKTFTVV